MRNRVQFRLLVVRLGAMGDILHALPAVTALRRMHPAWRIGWAVEPRWRSLLSAELDGPSVPELRTPARPLVDQVHLVPTKEWGRKPLSINTLNEILAMRRELRAADYDAVLDLQGAIRSAVVARLAGCRRVIGEDQPRENAARWLFSERVRTTGAHVIEQDIELASNVAGDLLEPAQPWLPVDAEAEQWCDQLAPLQSSKPLVLINPGAGWGAKRWPPERYGAVAAALAAAGATVLVNAGPGEESLAIAVVAAAQRKAAAVVCTLPQLIALTRRISLLVAGDTGPLHLACALGKPVVGIYGPTDPQRNGPFATPFRVLRSPGSVRDHTRRAEPEAGLLTIQAEEVIAAALELMPMAASAAEKRKEQI